MPFQKGQSGNPAGRKKGVKSRIPQSVKEAIERAFNDVGGVEYWISAWLQTSKNGVQYMALRVRATVLAAT